MSNLPPDDSLYHGLKRQEELLAAADPAGVRYVTAEEMQEICRANSPMNLGARKFDTGATRDVDTDKPDYEGFLSPLVVEAFGEYMHAHRKMKDGSMRASDNWQLGIPMQEFMKSGWRHFFDWWKLHRGLPARDTMVRTLCAIMFNVMGYLHEHLKKNAYPPKTGLPG